MKKYIFLLFLFLFPFSSLQAEEMCQRVNVRTGLFCSTEMGNPDWYQVPETRCSGNSTLGTHCCCGPNIQENKPSPKFILIGTIVSFFAILTAVVLSYKKNE